MKGPVDFEGGISSGQANPAKSRPLRVDYLGAAVSKTSRRAKPGNNRLSRSEARGRGGWPQISAIILDSLIGLRVRARVRVRALGAQSGAVSLNVRETPEGSLALWRCRTSIFRSTSVALIDDRRCRRTESQSCPRPAARASLNARASAHGTSCPPDRQSADGLTPTSLSRAICLGLPASCRGSGNCSFRSWSSSSTKC